MRCVETSPQGSGSVAFRLQLTTPACPVKGEFERQVKHCSHHRDVTKHRWSA